MGTRMISGALLIFTQSSTAPKRNHSGTLGHSIRHERFSLCRSWFDPKRSPVTLLNVERDFRSTRPAVLFEKERFRVRQEAVKAAIVSPRDDSLRAHTREQTVFLGKQFEAKATARMTQSLVRKMTQTDAQCKSPGQGPRITCLAISLTKRRDPQDPGRLAV